jgi:hypothetical protein
MTYPTSVVSEKARDFRLTIAEFIRESEGAQRTASLELFKEIIDQTSNNIWRAMRRDRIAREAKGGK